LDGEDFFFAIYLGEGKGYGLSLGPRSFVPLPPEPIGMLGFPNRGFNRWLTTYLNKYQRN